MHHHIDSSTCNRKASPFPVRKNQKKKKQLQNPNQFTTNSRPIPKLPPQKKRNTPNSDLATAKRGHLRPEKIQKNRKKKVKKGALELNRDENRRSEAYSEEDYAIGRRRGDRSSEEPTARANPHSHLPHARRRRRSL